MKLKTCKFFHIDEFLWAGNVQPHKLGQDLLNLMKLLLIIIKLKTCQFFHVGGFLQQN